MPVSSISILKNHWSAPTKKFIKRFQYLESESAKDGRKMGEMSLEEMDIYWNRAKKI